LKLFVGMANFGSLADMRKKEEEEAKDKGKATESYVGGERSGLAVENPDDHFKRMQELGQSEPAPSEGGARQITMYRNGFTVDGGPLRTLDDPMNKKFMDDVAKGQVPEEFGASSDVNVSVQDKRGEDYKEPTAGYSSSSRTPAVPAAIADPVAAKGEGSVTVDSSKPTTKIQIRFHDGSKKAQEFNQDQTVGDLRAFCSQVTGQAMTIKGGFPPKPLTDDAQTLKDAGLCGAAVTVQPA
jgi:UBX domain-containing protein 1